MKLVAGSTVARKYQVVRELGAGGMGTVYEAINTATERRIALKVMSRELRANGDACVRFIQEAIAVSRVDHPGIVQVYDAEDQADEPWIAMELLQGENLGERLARGPLTRAEIDDIFGQLLDVLAAVHREGIIHRDLKPDNVFLARVHGSRPAAGVRVKLLDFGIAKLTDSRAKTSTQYVMGSWQYMAPEQANSTRDVDQRADIYSLGVLLYQCLCGRLPYEAESFFEQFSKMAQQKPAPLDLPPDMKRYEEAALACLAVDPASRPPDCATLGQLLLPIATGSLVGGHYKLVREVGAGGMGRVYEAVDLRDERRVAVKVMNDALRGNADACRRFVQEVLAASRIPHPDILRIHEAAYEGQHLWIAMELLEGESLRSRLLRGPLAPAELARVFSELLDVLAAVHNAGIVHRDLKPENIFLARTPSSPAHVKLLDFGIAKLAHDNVGTRTGYALGTWRYMAPEQAQNAKEVDARADLYALGAILYECLSGRPPHGSGGILEHFSKRATGLPARLDCVPELRRFEEAALACLAVDPAERPASCRVLAMRLEPIKLGSLLGERYELTRELGYDDAGVRYQALDVHTEGQLEVFVAQPSLRDPALRQAFVDTAQRVVQIAHPHVARVHDADDDGRGPWMVSEALRGETLRDRLERGALGAEELSALVPALLDALAALHAAGLCHRALRPENVFLAQAESAPFRVKLCGIGLAQLVDAAHATRTDGGAGLWRYLAPEQVQQAGEVDARADLYAFGVILFECLAGRPPYATASVFEHFGKVSLEPPLAFDVPRELAQYHAAALACMRPSPGLRPSDAAAVARLVEGAFDPARHAAPASTPPTAIDMPARTFSTDHANRLMPASAQLRASQVPEPHAYAEALTSGVAPVADDDDDEGEAYDEDDALPSRGGVRALVRRIPRARRPLIVAIPAALLLLALGAVAFRARGPSASIDDAAAKAKAAAGARTTSRLAAGAFHTCAVLSDGELKCWGQGQLGYREPPRPADESPAKRGTIRVATNPGVLISQVAAGTSHTCALLSDRTLHCWGAAASGQLGYGNLQTIGDDEHPAEAGPVNVSKAPGVTVTHVAAGAEHTCAVLSDGSVKCWGRGEGGRLGYGNNKNVGDDERPSELNAVSVSKNPAVTVTQVVTGSEHTCALLSDRKVKCWGFGAVGQLGYGHALNVGDNEHPSTVGHVTVTRAPGVTVAQLVAGGFHTCALLSNGEVTCWGRGEGGRLGYGHTKHIGDNERPADAGTVRVSHTPGVIVTQLVAGTDHTCALLSDGTVKCWGYGHFGQLGYANTRNVGDDEVPADLGAIELTGGQKVNVVQLVAGGFHTCALLSDDSVRCWGDGQYGQLGYGHTRHVGDDEHPASAGAILL